jgi:hypothetical protein
MYDQHFIKKKMYNQHQLVITSYYSLDLDNTIILNLVELYIVLMLN